MLFYLLSPGELTELFDRLGYPFDPERDFPRNVDYYLARTSEGSTLSGSSIPGSGRLAVADPGNASWSASRLMSPIAGRDDPRGDPSRGEAGPVDIVERAYMGLAVRDDCLWFDRACPMWWSPSKWLHYREHRIRVEVSPMFFG